MSQSGGDGKKMGSGGDGDGGDKKGKGTAAADESVISPPVWSRIRGFTSSDEDDTASTPASGGLSALESALPMKRSLGGKTSSFGNLGDLPVDKNEELKKEDPINKRRRLSLAHDDKKTTAGGSSSANVALPAVDDQTNEEAAAYNVKDEGPKTASDDNDDEDET